MRNLCSNMQQKVHNHCMHYIAITNVNPQRKNKEKIAED